MDLDKVKSAIKHLESYAKEHADRFSELMIVSVRTIIAIAEAFRELEQRADAAQEQIAELEKQEPIYQLIDDGNWYDAEKYVYEECVRNGDKGRIVFTRAAPASPVKLPESQRLDGNGYGYYFDMNDIFTALEDAGIKFEVQK